MTIKELIDKLKEFPEDMEVIDYEGNYISKVELYEIDWFEDTSDFQSVEKNVMIR